MSHRMWIVALGVLVAAAASACADDDEFAEVPRSMDQLPQSVAATLRQQLEGREAEEIEEIRIEGLPVLYEAEYVDNGREVDVAIWPNGQPVQGRMDEGEDDDVDDEERDEEGEDADLDDDDEDENEMGERGVSLDDLPRPAADALRALLRGAEPDEIEEIAYEGLVVLYEVEVVNDDADENETTTKAMTMKKKGMTRMTSRREKARGANFIYIPTARSRGAKAA